MIQLPPFYRYPFVYLFMLFASGIVSNYCFDFQMRFDVFMGFFMICSLAYFLLKSQSQIRFWILIAFLMATLGALRMDLQLENTSEVQPNGKHFLRIKEYQEKEGWSKGIGQLMKVDKHQLIETHQSVLFFVNTKGKLLVNDVIAVDADLTPIQNKNNPGEFNMQLFWKIKDVKEMLFFQETDYKLVDKIPLSFWDKAMQKTSSVWTSFLEQHLTGNELAIAKALILGDKSDLDTETQNTFSATGTMHVLAVSGLHIGLIMQLLMAIAKYFSKYISRKKAITIIVGILWFYSVLTGFSPSIIRSIFMFSILMGAQLSGRNYNAINTLFFSAFIILLFQPMYLFDVGFQLSYLAMLGIFLLYEPIKNWFNIKNKWLRYVWEGTAVGFAAQVMTAPLTLYYFHQFPNYFAISNLGVMAFSGAILGLGIALLVVGKIPLLNSLVAWLLFASIFLMFLSIQWVEQLPGAVAYGFEISLFCSALLSFVLFLLVKLSPQSKYWKWASLSLVGALIFVIHTRFSNQEEKHICIFNNNQLLMVIKKGDQALCLYDALKEKEIKLKYTIDAYRKIYPSTMKYFNIRRKNIDIQFGNEKVSVHKKENGRLVRFNQKEIFIAYQATEISSKSTQVISMPWIQEKNSLENGAIILVQ